MNILTAIAVYIVFWWLAFLLVLPIGTKSQYEEGNIIEGTEPGAPVRPQLRKKIIWAIILSMFFFLLFYSIITFKFFEWTDIPFFSKVDTY